MKLTNKIKTLLKWALIPFVIVIMLMAKKIKIDFTKPRGIRNNNPGNLRITNNNWQGKVPNHVNTDGDFEQFYEMQYGVRAMTKLLINYTRMSPSITLSGMIHKYAPTSENNTTAYIKKVTDATDLTPDTIMSSKMSDFIIVKNMVTAMIKHENGKGISETDISKGIGFLI